MHRIAFDILGELLADSTFRRICGVGGPHYLAPMLDGVLAFQHQYNDGALRHESHQTREKRSLAMDLIKSLSLLPGKPDHLHAANAESGMFDHLENLARVAVGDGVRFNNCESLLDCHG